MGMRVWECMYESPCVGVCVCGSACVGVHGLACVSC